MGAAEKRTTHGDELRMKGAPELQGGVVMLLVGAAGLAVLWLWGGSASPAGTGTVFTSHGFVSAVAGFMFVGVFAIGAALIVLGGVLWLIQRMRDAKTRG